MKDTQGGGDRDCVGAWSEYEACEYNEEKDANQRCKTYSHIVVAENNGEDCDFAAGTKVCGQAGCDQPVDCEWQWSGYGQCAPSTDSNGVVVNQRCKAVEVTTQPDEGGETCPHPNGYTVCTTDFCGQPTDCLGTWYVLPDSFELNAQVDLKQIRQDIVDPEAPIDFGDAFPVQEHHQWSTCSYNGVTEQNERCRT